MKKKQKKRLISLPLINQVNIFTRIIQVHRKHRSLTHVEFLVRMGQNFSENGYKF